MPKNNENFDFNDMGNYIKRSNWVSLILFSICMITLFLIQNEVKWLNVFIMFGIIYDAYVIWKFDNKENLVLKQISITIRDQLKLQSEKANQFSTSLSQIEIDYNVKMSKPIEEIKSIRDQYVQNNLRLNQEIEFKRKELKDEINKMHFQAENDKLELNKQISDLKDKIKNQYKEYQNEKLKFSIKQNFLAFIKEYKIMRYNLDSNNYDIDFPNITTEMEHINKLCQTSLYSKLVIVFLYEHFKNMNNDDNWQKIRQSEEAIQELVSILLNSGKIIDDFNNFPFDFTSSLIKKISSFNLEYLNHLIQSLKKYTDVFLMIRTFFRKNNLKLVDTHVWDEFFKKMDKKIIELVDPNEILIDLISSSIDLDIESKYRKNIRDFVLYLFIIQNIPELMNAYSSKLSNNPESCIILRLYYQELRKFNIINDFLIFLLPDLEKKITIMSKESLQNKFCEELAKGHLIINEDELFSQFIQDRVSSGVYDKNYSYLFDPKFQINLNSALKNVFALKINSKTLFQCLTLTPFIRPYLISYKSENAFANFFKSATNVDSKEFNLNDKYSMDTYTNCSQIGVLNSNICNFNDLQKNLEKDLVDQLQKKNATQIEDCWKIIKKLNPIFAQNIKNFDDTELEEKFNEILKFKYDRDEFRYSLNIYQQQLPVFKKTEFNNDVIKLDGLVKQIPCFQLLIHELRYDPNSILLFGPMIKIDPIEKIKKIFAKTIRDPKTLIALLEYDQNSKTIGEIDREIIRNLSLFDFISCNNQITQIISSEKLELLDRSKTLEFCQTIDISCKNLLDLSIFVSKEYGLYSKETESDREKLLEIIQKTYEDTKDFIEIIKNFFKANLKLGKDEKYIPEFTKQFVIFLIYIALVMFSEEFKIPKIKYTEINHSKRSEIIILNSIKTAGQLQQGKIKYLKKENDLSLNFSQLLGNLIVSYGWNCSEQKLAGRSFKGKELGELDFYISDEKQNPITICEALFLRSNDSTQIQQHLTKIFEYDCNGLDFNIIFVYAMANKFIQLWKNYLQSVPKIPFKYKLSNENVLDISHEFDQFKDIKIGKTIHEREGGNIILYHICINLN